jgi:hypothetical protein
MPALAAQRRRRRGFGALLCLVRAAAAQSPAAAAAAGGCASPIALDAPLSLRSALAAPPPPRGASPSSSSSSSPATPPPLFLRHAGFVAWLTPSADALDAADSTFAARRARTRAGFRGVSARLCLHNQEARLPPRRVASA